MVSKTASISRRDGFHGSKLSELSACPEHKHEDKLAIDLRIFRPKHRKCFFPFDVYSAVLSHCSSHLFLPRSQRTQGPHAKNFPNVLSGAVPTQRRHFISWDQFTR